MVAVVNVDELESVILSQNREENDTRRVSPGEKKQGNVGSDSFNHKVATTVMTASTISPAETHPQLLNRAFLVAQIK